MLGGILCSLQGLLKEIPDFPRFRIPEAKLNRTLRVWSKVFDFAAGVKPPSLWSQWRMLSGVNWDTAYQVNGRVGHSEYCFL